MINAVRNTVMAAINKDNNGYITPEEFNLFARQAQLEVYEEYFYDFNGWVTKQNARKSNSGYTDIPKQLEEVIDTFSRTPPALAGVANVFTLPTDWYYINVVLYQGVTVVERVHHNKEPYLLASNLTAPNVSFPAYTMNGASTTQPGNSITVYPVTIANPDITIKYVRYPLDPKWTFNVVGGSPIFNPAAADYQDFEMPYSDQPTLVLKILQYAGVNIREPEVVQFSSQEELIEDQKEE